MSGSTSERAHAWQADLLERYPAHIVDGFPCYARHILEEGQATGYNPASHRELAALEAGNWWFRSRNAMILGAVERWFPEVRTYLEIGCGTGFVLSGISQALPDLHMVGSELFLTGLAETRERLPDVCLVQMDARHVPFINEFALIGAFDVIEHIEDDLGVLRNIHAALHREGGLILTVPQHEWMWSLADEHAHHVRRYTRRSLHTVVENAGFEILWSRSFVSLLSPLMVLSRRGGKEQARHDDPYLDFRINPVLNRALEQVSTAERGLIRRGVRFPVGGSRLVVARKATGSPGMSA